MLKLLQTTAGDKHMYFFYAAEVYSDAMYILYVF